ncbi:hypothetical protein [Sphingomonas hylomeconis]|uniref:TonB C-terminal domain-containing protein n=1 Tax=Sphingomonas hylomeconis TaxID=1395958 RepID=A0ABV7SV33_9SPHN|nr:hypothetical protein [Sphingomonas hylomeconis]
MMIAPILIAAAQIAAAPAVPTDWSLLAPLPYVATPQQAPALANFVAGEITAGRCPIARPADGRYVVRVEIATLVGADGVVRRTVPRAINCPTVEQFSAGLVLSFARGNLQRTTTDQWYRATIVFDWNA